MARFGRSRPGAVVPLGDLAAPRARRDTQAGALARALATAARLRVGTPESWVVVAGVFRHVVQSALPPGHDPASLLRALPRPVGVERAARARELLLEVVLESDLEREIDAAWRDLGEAAPWGVAVRASAVVGDQGIARLAGLSSTELPVFDRESLGAAIRRVWARCVSEATLGYLRGRRMRDVAIAVVLQPVVVARASVTLITDARTVLGPAFRVEPGKTLRLAIVTRGLATEGAELVEAEAVVFDVAGQVRARQPSSQAMSLVVRENAPSWVPVDGGRGDALSAADLVELAEVARRLDAQGGVVARCVLPPQGEAMLVDLCPLHHLGFPGTGTAQTLWARASPAEAPAEPLTALSRYLLSRSILDRSRQVLGERTRSAKLAGIVATIDGRAYLSLSAVTDHAGGREPADATMRAELVSAQWASELAREPAFRPSLARAGLRIAQIATEQRVLSDEVGRFEREADRQRRWLAEMDLAILPDDALQTTLREVSDFLMRAYDLHSKAHALALGGHALLASVVAGVDKARASWLAHAVTAGADVITSRPAAALAHVAAIARYDAVARDRLVGAAVASPSDLPEGPLRRALGHFLEAYGDRSLSEAELATPRWGEDARPLSLMLAAALRAGPTDPDVAQSRARALADRQLVLLEPGLSFFETRVVRDIVSRERELLRLRERCRARVAHGLAMMRVVALDVDRRLRRLDPTLEVGAALSLTLDELEGAVAKYRADLAPIVRARRADLARCAGTRHPSPVFRGVPEPICPSRFDGSLQGLAGSGGVGEGKVVRLDGALERLGRFNPGDVLVVRTLDLGLAPLFLQAGAIVAELGTPFSSSAVVARDCGVPVVLGVPIVSALVRDGTHLRVDGDAGTVELVLP
jgi:pyruvate,water dikinase